MRVPDFLKHTTVFLYGGTGTKRAPIGTGFFIHITENDITFPFLVTCKHVVKPVLKRVEVVYARLNRNDKPGVVFCRLPDTWQYHSDPTIDLAILPWQPTGQPVYFGMMDFDDILPKHNIKIIKALQNVGEGEEVLFTALFHEIVGQKRNTPVIRFGRVALITDEPIEGEYGPFRQHVLECQAYPGNSGAPLFITLPYNDRPTLFLFGVIVAHYPEIQKLQTSNGDVRVYTHFGISTAVPSERIAEILSEGQIMETRQQEIGRKRKEEAPEPVSMLDSQKGALLQPNL